MINRRNFIKSSTVLAAGLTLPALARAADQQGSTNGTGVPQRGAGTANRGAVNSIRIHYPVADNLTMFRELMEILRNRKEMKTQITFFMAVSHPPMPFEAAVHQAKVLGERMQTAREYGFESGINILSTIGHHEENLDNSLQGDFTPMTNIDGAICRGSFCPNDENMRKHIERLYQLIVDAKPDYIWVDDDVRFGHMPIGNGCFCDNCLEIFAKEYGKKYTRGELKEALNDLGIALKWIQHNRNTLNRLFTLIEQTVRESDPSTGRKLPLGFMTGERYYEGYAFEEIADILQGTEGREVYWRPGGGAYTDEPLYGLIEKSHQIGRQVSLLPPYVRIIQSEIENFPYQTIKKSPVATALEAASHIAAGCTGAAYNILPVSGETPGDILPMFDKLKETQPFYDLLVKTFGRTPPKGIYTGWTRDLGAVMGDPGNFAKELLEMGFPAAYSLENASATVLSGHSAKVMPADRIETILSGGVYMDPRALICLNELGYGELTGFAVKDFLDKDCIEVFAEHRLNEGMRAGAERNCYQAFYRGDAAVIASTNPDTQILSYMKDYSGNVLSECSWGVFENRLGGRICIAGYYPWGHIQSRPKFAQLKNIFRYLSKDTLPSITENYCRIHNWTRRLDNGIIAAAVINGSLETLESTVLLLKTDSKRCVCYDMRCRKSECLFMPGRSHSGYNAFSIPLIQPWQMVLIVTE